MYSHGTVMACMYKNSPTQPFKAALDSAKSDIYPLYVAMQDEGK